MSATTRYRLLRRHPPVPAGSVLELGPDEDPTLGDEVFLLWPGDLGPIPEEGGLPLRRPVSWEGSICTLERLAAGVPLSELALSADDPAWVQVVAGVVAAMEALHRAGLSHGHIGEDRVWVGVDGRVRLVGAGAAPGSPGADALALEELWPDRTVSEESTDRGTLPLGLQEALGQQVEGVLKLRPRPAEAGSVLVEPLSPPLAGVLDEVGFDLGTDGEVGILDGWTAGGSTGEATGTLHGDPGAAHARMAVLARIGMLAETAGRDVEDGPPIEAIRQRLRDEPPIPLPSPAFSKGLSRIERSQEERPSPTKGDRVLGRAGEGRTPNPQKHLLVFGLGALLILASAFGLLLLLAAG